EGGGKMLWSQVQDAAGHEIHLRDFPTVGGELSSTHALIQDTKNPRPIYGVFITERGAMLVSSRSVGGGHHPGPPVGTFIAGRLLDASLARTLADRTQVDFDV